LKIDRIMRSPEDKIWKAAIQNLSTQENKLHCKLNTMQLQ
jgi:hypothetical protein